MGTIRPMEQACLLIGVLCKDDDVLTSYMEGAKEFGAPALISPALPFHFTDYYTATMGAPLIRRFYLYGAGFDVESLADVKIRTNSLESEAAKTIDLGVERPLNLDPGYLTLSKLILASTKDNIHRIYHKKGLFVENTLFYRAKSYRPWPWTYPDYASQPYIDFLNRARNELLRS